MRLEQNRVLTVLRYSSTQSSEREAEARRGLRKKCNRTRRRVGRENNRSRDRHPFGGDEDSVSAVALGAALGREFNGPEAWGGAEEFEAY